MSCQSPESIQKATETENLYEIPVQVSSDGPSSVYQWQGQDENRAKISSKHQKTKPSPMRRFPARNPQVRNNPRTVVVLGIIIVILLFFIVIAATCATLMWPTDLQCTDTFQVYNEQYKIKIRLRKSTFAFDELDKADYQKLVNLTDFKFTIYDRNVCENRPVFLLILVKISPENQKGRNLIRKTWGEKRENVILLFVMGITEDKEIQQVIEKESKLYSDIVQGNVIASDKNQAYISFMCLKYVIYHCPESIYILMTEDNQFVNTPLLLNFLKNDISPYGAENLLICKNQANVTVIRDLGHQYCASLEEFPFQVYPSYCSRLFSILSPDIVFRLYKEGQKLKYFYISDVFVFGLAAERANVTHVDMKNYTLSDENLAEILNGTNDRIPIMIGKAFMSLEEMESLYDYYKDKPVRQSIHKRLGEI